ncbi:hypothetical protein HH1059_02170 [Halorhodospira halochloris]|uniref:Uncharacterized protein n=1 Tax=Halorhodospira halochloris TaxID=1052 RepID=A0A2Z6EZB8_HALHR|nr:hypothetical protein HH1059_02170 [Halorhodospira halochloris]
MQAPGATQWRSNNSGDAMTRAGNLGQGALYRVKEIAAQQQIIGRITGKAQLWKDDPVGTQLIPSVSDTIDDLLPIGRYIADPKRQLDHGYA